MNIIENDFIGKRDMMQTANKNPIFNDPEWYYLGEFTLRERSGDVEQQDEFMALSERYIIGDLGIPPACLNNIERTLTRFAMNAMADLDQGRSELPVSIRTFCKKKTVEDVNLPKTSSQFSGRDRLEPVKIFHHSDAEVNGGWGFFLVDRIGSCAPNPAVSENKLVDLYLYKEGE